MWSSATHFPDVSEDAFPARRQSRISDAAIFLERVLILNRADADISSNIIKTDFVAGTHTEATANVAG
jgi:hypothetical protein